MVSLSLVLFNQKKTWYSIPGSWRVGGQARILSVNTPWYSGMGMAHGIPRIKGKLPKFLIFHLLATIQPKKHKYCEYIFLALRCLYGFWTSKIFSLCFLFGFVLFFKCCSLLHIVILPFQKKVLFGLQFYFYHNTLRWI